MTRFADSKFSVAALPTAEYAEGHARTFAPQGEDKKCTECDGEARIARSGCVSGYDECAACDGTGLRSYQHTWGE